MGIITRMRQQTCVYWAPKMKNGLPVKDRYGKPEFEAPVEMTCRWTDKHEMVSVRRPFDTSKIAEERISKAKVFTETVVSDNGGMLFLGTLADLPVSYKTPEEIEGAEYIMRFEEVQKLRPDPNEVLRKAWL